MAKFVRGYNVMVRCRCCKKLTHSESGHGTELCRLCFDSASAQNEHLDEGPDHSFTPHDQCPTCQGVSCLHEVAK